MKTEVLQFDLQGWDARRQHQLERVAGALKEGQLVAFPTETVYGLGANANLDASVQSIYTVKGRPQDNPLIVHLSDLDQLETVAMDIPTLAYDLYEHFAPGPLTLILKRRPEIPSRVSAGLETVAVRFPAHPIARLLIQEAHIPVVAPSANLSGKPSPTRAWHVLEDMNGRIPFILDGGPCKIGVESTVLDTTGEDLVVLRPGALSPDQLSKVCQKPVYLPDSRPKTCSEKNESGDARIEVPRAPGMKYRHYAPQARVIILPTNREGWNELIESTEAGGEPPAKRGYYISQEAGVSLTSEGRIREEDQVIAYCDGAVGASEGLFDAFRQFDDQGITFIFVEAQPETGAGLAFMNRLTKAAANEKKPLA